MRLGANPSRELGVDQVLQRGLQQLPEQIPGVTATKTRHQVRYSGIIIKGHRVFISYVITWS